MTPAPTPSPSPVDRGSPPLAVWLNVSDAIGGDPGAWDCEIDDLLAGLHAAVGEKLGRDGMRRERLAFATRFAFEIHSSQDLIGCIDRLLGTSPLRAAVQLWIRDDASSPAVWREVALAPKPDSGSRAGP